MRVKLSSFRLSAIPAMVIIAVIFFSAMVLFYGCQNSVPVTPDSNDNLDKGGMPLSTTLSGSEEVPTGDLTASGFATIWLNYGKGTIAYNITAADFYNPQSWPAPATGAHIHFAPAGSNGGVVLALTAPDETGTSSGIINVDPLLIKAIKTNPDQYYINVHTYAFPAGAIRGQLGD